MAESDFFTIEGLMKKLGVSRTTLWRWRKDGEGPPCYKAGDQVRYPKDEFERWKRDNAIVTLDDTPTSATA